MKKTLTILFIGIFIISFASSIECFQTFKQGSEINLIQKCPSCSYVNITSITYPNGTIFLNDEMTKAGINFNFTLPDSSQLGKIIYGTIGDKNGASPPNYEDLCIDITQTGFKINTAKAILYSVMLAFLLFIFGLLMWALFQIPRDIKDDEGFVINVSKLEYLRPIVKGLAWIVLTSITFIIANIAIAYLSTGLMGSFLFLIYQLMMLSNLVIIPLMIIQMIQRITLSKEMLGLIERGVKF